MASSTQSNPVYYSLSSLSSGQNLQSRTVVLHKRPDHDGFGVYIGEDIPSGLYIVTIERNSPASDANIQPGDRVLAVNGQLVSSMSKNPKETLMKAASNADSLTLTIQSNNILQTLQIKSTNDYQNNNDHSVKQNSSKRTSAINLDLENYIKSLFIDENVQILQTPNNNEFTFKSDSNKKSSMPFNSTPNRYYYASNQKKERPRQRHSKRTIHRETREIQTQTSFDDDEYPTYPTNTNSDFTALPPSPRPNNGTLNSAENSHPTQQQQHMADVVEAAMIEKKNREKVNKHKQTTSREQVSTTKRPTTPPSPESPPLNSSPVTEQITTPPTSRYPQENSSRDAAAVTTRTTAPPTSRDAAAATTRTTTQTTSRDAAASTTQPTSRDAAAATKQPTSRDAAAATTQPTSRDAAAATKQPTSRDAAAATTQPTSRDAAAATTQPTSRDAAAATKQPTSRDAAAATARTTTPPPPPPYSETAVAVVPVKAPNNQADAEEHQAAAVATVVEVSHDEGLREVHLHRSPDFQGFGFHLQYNKTYYLVQSVEADSPAQQGDLHANDVIHSINHQTTTNMPHGVFVETVNANSDIDLTVQTLNAFLRANPPPVRNQQMAAAVAAAINNETDKRKGGVSKALGKLTSR